jgi:hypothetical protein
MKKIKDKQANAPDAEQYRLGVKAHVDEKGRITDLKRIHDLADALMETMQGND